MGVSIQAKVTCDHYRCKAEAIVTLSVKADELIFATMKIETCPEGWHVCLDKWCYCPKHFGRSYHEG